MNITKIIQEGVVDAVKHLYDSEITAESVSLNTTRSEFEGDYTVVVFAYARVARKKPEAIAEDLGKYLVENVEHIEAFNVVKGFCNLVVSEKFWVNFLAAAAANDTYGTHPATGKKVMVEFSSPNTNKPLHLGHIRNILLGWSVNKMFQAAGYETIKTQIINDRGIAVCKSMLAWQLFGNGETPADTGTKGDHFVGKFYVKFANELKAEYTAWQATDVAKSVFSKKKKDNQDEAAFFAAYKNDYFNEYSKLGAQAKALLLKWEANDDDTRALWAKMNGWVYEGYNETYKNLGVDFDTLYYESDTYLLGKEIIAEGLEKDVFTQDGKRIMVELDNLGLGTKTVIKSDGTSTYTSQDLGTAQVRYKEYGTERMVYVVGDEQIAHFQGVFEILKRMGEPYADGLFHLAYGMIDLTTGKMKSREGTIVDADDLMKEVIGEARDNAQERGELVDLSEAEREDIYRKIGLAALKYFILKVNPQKRMTFNPTESLDTQGNTGPYIQYSFVRITGILKRAAKEGVDFSKASQYTDLQPLEKDILNQLYQYPGLVLQAAEQYEPSLIANFCYALAKNYSKFWHDVPVFNAETEEAKAFRLTLSKMVGKVIEKGMDLLGVEMPERM
jgi:arginyl-tRNA synthetase